MKDCIELIKDIAKNYPERIAVIDGNKNYSYGEFINLVNTISKHLFEINANPKVLFDLKQGVDAYALIISVLNIGGTYCPLNQDAPIERKKQIISEFKPDYIISEKDDYALTFEDAKNISIGKLIENNDYSDLVIQYDEENIVYVIYTSGTTGIPKGVMICRKALNKFLEWSIPTYGANENDIWGQFSFLSFDLSIVDIFTCLCSGATLFSMNNVLSKKYRPSSIIENQKITVWHSIPSAIEFMKKNDDSKKYDFSSLRLMSFCGEPLRLNQLDFLYNKNNGLTILNTYGPTEGTLFCTYQLLRINNYNDFCQTTMSIGKAIPGWKIYLEPNEESTYYEVIIYGDYIGKGYLGVVSDSKFKQIEIEGALVNCFETGDLVSEQKGDLYFIGRKDRQVKIKGHRIELEEIDFRINEFLNKTSVTLDYNDSLYSFVETEEEIREDELRGYLKQKLEPCKIPNTFYKMQEIPRSHNQKVNTIALIERIK